MDAYRANFYYEKLSSAFITSKSPFSRLSVSKYTVFLKAIVLLSHLPYRYTCCFSQTGYQINPHVTTQKGQQKENNVTKVHETCFQQG